FTPLGQLPLEVPVAVETLAIDPHTGVLYAARNGLWRSSDAGRHWETISSTLDGSTAVTVDGIGDVYAFGYTPYNANLILWHCTPASGTLEKLTTPLIPKLWQRLVANPARRGVLYATAPGGLYLSMDGGHSWRGVLGGGQTVTDVAVDPNRPDVVYAAASGGL